MYFTGKDVEPLPDELPRCAEMNSEDEGKNRAWKYKWLRGDPPCRLMPAEAQECDTVMTDICNNRDPKMGFNSYQAMYKAAEKLSDVHTIHAACSKLIQMCGKPTMVRPLCEYHAPANPLVGIGLQVSQ